MNTVAFVFARGGSKGLPDKNILKLGGRPLIAWSIKHALEVARIDRVIVSTDSEEIAEIACKYGAEVPFIRPKEFAKDDSPEWLTWRHALNFLKSSTGAMPEMSVSIPPTAPLRFSSDIENCLDRYEKGDLDVVITATDAHRSPFFNMVKTNEDGTSSLVNSTASTVIRRQDTPLVYDMTTVCYVAKTSFVMKHESIFDGRVGAVHVPVERAIDIDTLLDFQIAEALLSKRNGIDDNY